MRWSGVIAVSLALSALTAPAAAAVPELRIGDDEADQDDSYAFVVTDVEPGVDGGAVVGGGVGEPPLFTISYRVLDTNAVGADCTRWTWIVGWDEAARGPAADAVRLGELAFLAATGGAAPPACSAVALDTSAPPREAAARIADTLTAATPYLQPGNEAITGLRSFLDLGIDADRTETITVTLFGRDWDVEITVTGVHTIDWGDGTVDTGVVGSGGPWHDGATQTDDIVHTYRDSGTYDVTVTTDWTVTATLLSDGSTATQTRTTTSVPQPITVDEVRAVRDR